MTDLYVFVIFTVASVAFFKSIWDDDQVPFWIGLVIYLIGLAVVFG